MMNKMFKLALCITVFGLTSAACANTSSKKESSDQQISNDLGRLTDSDLRGGYRDSGDFEKRSQLLNLHQMNRKRDLKAMLGDDYEDDDESLSKMDPITLSLDDYKLDDVGRTAPEMPSTDLVSPHHSEDLALMTPPIIPDMSAAEVAIPEAEPILPLEQQAVDMTVDDLGVMDPPAVPDVPVAEVPVPEVVPLIFPEDPAIDMTTEDLGLMAPPAVPDGPAAEVTIPEAKSIIVPEEQGIVAKRKAFYESLANADMEIAQRARAYRNN